MSDLSLGFTYTNPYQSSVTQSLMSGVHASSAGSDISNQLGSVFDDRYLALLQQISHKAGLNDALENDFVTSTKTKTLNNFAQLTDIQMDAKVMKNLFEKTNTYIQMA